MTLVMSRHTIPAAWAECSKPKELTRLKMSPVPSRETLHYLSATRASRSLGNLWRSTHLLKSRFMMLNTSVSLCLTLKIQTLFVPREIKAKVAKEGIRTHGSASTARPNTER